MTTLLVLRTGPLALVQDLGRPGYAHLGVPPSGAVDRPALLLANALVGNPESAAGVEVMLGGLAVRASGPCVVAVTGAPAPLRSNADERPFARPIDLSEGDELRIGTPRRGLRCYLAASGGLDVPATLGSRSTDVLSDLGPPPLKKGDELPLGRPGDRPREVDTPACIETDLELPVLLGPRDDWCKDAAAQLLQGEWTIAPSSNRIGVRLDGTRLRRRAGELPTEPVVTGAVQVPPDGQPVIFLNDHPTTGGYPVIGVVHPDALPALGQARPGYRVRLRPYTGTPNSPT
jgi:biotin-dependent carboxylase-like uncharacterized protein